MYCPTCGYFIKDEFKFCANCGSAVVKSPAEPPRPLESEKTEVSASEAPEFSKMDESPRFTLTPEVTPTPEATPTPEVTPTPEAVPAPEDVAVSEAASTPEVADISNVPHSSWSAVFPDPTANPSEPETPVVSVTAEAAPPDVGVYGGVIWEDEELDDLYDPDNLDDVEALDDFEDADDFEKSAVSVSYAQDGTPISPQLHNRPHDIGKTEEKLFFGKGALVFCLSVILVLSMLTGMFMGLYIRERGNNSSGSSSERRSTSYSQNR